MNETIVSWSSGASKAAIAIIRLSGDNCFDIVRHIFSNVKETYEHQKFYYGHILENQEIVDEVMISFFVAPKTFTCENMAEINCHGNPLIIQRIISLCIQYGARLAERGEFTKRAFLNGRIDLINAESINDLINATNKQAIRLALSGLKGITSDYVTNLSHELLDVLTTIEVNIDYPEYDDVEQLTHLTILPKLEKNIALLDKVIQDTKKGQIVKNGIDTVIIGKPNVGKSSLLNALLNEDKAIVTDIAGTTRDIVEGSIDFDGISLNLIDTAGIRKGKNKIEQLGIQKSYNALQKAQFVLLVLDGSTPLTEQDNELLELTKDKERIVILNKTDLKSVVHLEESVNISAKNRNISELENKIKEKFKTFLYNEEPLLFNARQLGLLQQAKQHLLDAKNQALAKQVIDLIFIDIQEAYKNILEILGKTTSLDILDNVFSKFCLGK